MALPPALKNISGRHSGPRIVRALMQGQVPYALRPRLWYQQRVTLADFTPAAATSQVLTLDSLFTSNVFPDNVDLLAGACVRNNALPTGTPTGVTLLLGGTFDSGADDNGLVTSSSLLGGGAAAGDILNTPAAARYGAEACAALDPIVTLGSSGGNLSTLSSIDFTVFIPWSPRVA